MTEAEALPAHHNGEFWRALATLAEPPAPEHQRIIAALDIKKTPDMQRLRMHYTDTFVLRCYPYASVYLGSEGMLGGEARDRIAGFWRALGTTPPAEPDHLAILLAGYAMLCERCAEDDRWMVARRGLLFEHLLSWLPPWLNRVEALGSDTYAQWAALVNQALDIEVEQIGQPPRLPLHLREAPVLADPRNDGGDAFLRGLLAPAVTGVIILRDDLVQAGRDGGLGNRVGERRFMLRTLLEQDAGMTLRWLADWAHARIAGYRTNAAMVDCVADHWCERAEATASLLDNLAGETRHDELFKAAT